MAHHRIGEATRAPRVAASHGFVRQPMAEIMFQRMAMKSIALPRAINALPSIARVRVSSLYSAVRLLMKVRLSAKSLPLCGHLEAEGQPAEAQQDASHERGYHVEQPHLGQPVGRHSDSSADESHGQHPVAVRQVLDILEEYVDVVCWEVASGSARVSER